MIYLETDRLRLREFTHFDVENLVQLDGDPEVMKYLTEGAPSTPEHVQAYLKRIIELNKRYDGKFGFWVVDNLKSSEFMGWFHFRPDEKKPEDTARIELGYRFKKEFWGKGNATEGSRALIAKGFNELGVKQVFARTMKANIGSQKVMKKVGMVFSHEFYAEEHPGSREKDVEYVLEVGNWKAKVQVVAAIIKQGNKFLLGKRSNLKSKAAGYWCPISGQIESNETEEEAVVREVFEEVDLAVSPTRKVVEFDTHDKKGRIHWWLVSIKSGEPRIKNEEHSDLKWVTLKEMEALSPIYAEDLELYKKLIQNPKTG